MVRLLPILLILSILSCNGQSLEYSLRLEQVVNTIGNSKTLTNSEILDVIPTSQDEYLKFYSLTDPDRKELWDSFYEMVVMIEKRTENNEIILKKYLEMSLYVDGEFAEAYFDFIGYYVEHSKEDFCKIFPQLDKEKRKRIEYYFEDHCK